MASQGITTTQNIQDTTVSLILFHMVYQLMHSMTVMCTNQFIIILHDNARPHTTNLMKATFAAMG
jgi:hypothetical protein